jgi:hypothetical protein
MTAAKVTQLLQQGEARIAFNLVPSWEGKSAKLPSLKWSNYEWLTNSDSVKALASMRMVSSKRRKDRSPLGAILCDCLPIEARRVFPLVSAALFSTIVVNTRAVPLVHKENAHQGRVFFCPDLRCPKEGALPLRLLSPQKMAGSRYAETSQKEPPGSTPPQGREKSTRGLHQKVEHISLIHAS